MSDVQSRTELATIANLVMHLVGDLLIEKGGLTGPAKALANEAHVALYDLGSILTDGTNIILDPKVPSKDQLAIDAILPLMVEVTGLLKVVTHALSEGQKEMYEELRATVKEMVENAFTVGPIDLGEDIDNDLEGDEDREDLGEGFEDDPEGDNTRH